MTLEKKIKQQKVKLERDQILIVFISEKKQKKFHEIYKSLHDVDRNLKAIKKGKFAIRI